jgi:DNA invertase Pin-like site-specific DNA recombinase
VSQRAIVKVQRAAADYKRKQEQADRARERFEQELRSAVAAGVSQSELARSIKVSRQIISRRLRGGT